MGNTQGGLANLTNNLSPFSGQSPLQAAGQAFQPFKAAAGQALQPFSAATQAFQGATTQPFSAATQAFNANVGQVFGANAGQAFGANAGQAFGANAGQLGPQAQQLLSQLTPSQAQALLSSPQLSPRVQQLLSQLTPQDIQAIKQVPAELQQLAPQLRQQLQQLLSQLTPQQRQSLQNGGTQNLRRNQQRSTDGWIYADGQTQDYSRVQQKGYSQQTGGYRRRNNRRNYDWSKKKCGCKLCNNNY